MTTKEKKEAIEKALLENGFKLEGRDEFYMDFRKGDMSVTLSANSFRFSDFRTYVFYKWDSIDDIYCECGFLDITYEEGYELEFNLN